MLAESDWNFKKMIEKLKEYISLLFWIFQKLIGKYLNLQYF